MISNNLLSQFKKAFKKYFVFVIFTFFIILSTILLFVSASDYDLLSNNVSNKLVKNIELSDYYGMSFLLIDLHLDIGKGASNEEGIFYVVDLLNDMKRYVELDVIKYLGYSLDIGHSLESYLSDVSDILDKGMSAKVNLENNLVLLAQKKQDCDDSKNISDKNFSLALKDLDSKSMEVNLEKSLNYEICAGNARIYYNVQDKILDKLNFYYEILEDKYAYYLRNSAEVIQYYPEISYELMQK